jgi:hypothetical protein
MAKKVAKVKALGTIGAVGIAVPEDDVSKKEPLFPNLRRAMKRNQDASDALKPATYFRFIKGELPANLEWFLEYPDMLDALATDAREMSEEDWRAFRSQIRKRSKAQKARRTKSE